jgi:hypothetical protein
VKFCEEGHFSTPAGILITQTEFVFVPVCLNSSSKYSKSLITKRICKNNMKHKRETTCTVASRKAKYFSHVSANPIKQKTTEVKGQA